MLLPNHVSSTDVCEVSFQVPSPGMTIRIFLMEKTCTERNEKTFYLYMIPEGDCRVKPYD